MTQRRPKELDVLSVLIFCWPLKLQYKRGRRDTLYLRAEIHVAICSLWWYVCMEARSGGAVAGGGRGGHRVDASSNRLGVLRVSAAPAPAARSSSALRSYLVRSYGSLLLVPYPVVSALGFFSQYRYMYYR